MPITPARPPGYLTHAEIRARGVRPDDIDENWLDMMVKRLFLELQRQLSQVENAKPAPETEQASLRAANARTLASLERTMERLAKLEQQRACMRETRMAARNDSARAELERRIHCIIAAARTPSGFTEPE
jgi:hypothetical protein